MDQLLVARGFAASREEARRLIMAGMVRPADGTAGKPGRAVPDDFELVRTGTSSRYVSRGGLKLEGALRDFGIDVSGVTLALDVGASTGGFTDCLLQHGVAEVIAVDTGRGQIHERLRREARVRLLEQVNARHLTADQLDGRRPELIVMDVSFISIRLLLPALAGVLAPGGRVLTLVKPQFEAGRKRVASGGIVRDPEVHREVLESTISHCVSEGWEVSGPEVSRLAGGGGNIEFFLLLSREGTDRAGRPGGEAGAGEYSERIGRSLDAARELQSARERATEESREDAEEGGAEGCTSVFR